MFKILISSFHFSILTAIVCVDIALIVWRSFKVHGNASSRHLMIASWLLAAGYLAMALPRLAFSLKNPWLLWAFPLSHVFFFSALAFLSLIPVSFRFPGKEKFVLYPLLGGAVVLTAWLTMNFSYDSVLAVSYLAYWYMEPNVAWAVAIVLLAILLFSATIFFSAIFNAKYRRGIKIRSLLFALGLLVVAVGMGMTYLWTSSAKYPLHQFIDIIGFILVLVGALYRPEARPAPHYDIPKPKEQSSERASLGDHEPPEFTEWQ